MPGKERSAVEERLWPAGMRVLQQRARLYRLISAFNEERPHEALGMKRPADLYAAPTSMPRRSRLSRPAGRGRPAPRPRRPGHRLRPPLHALQKINFSTSPAGQRRGIKEVDDAIWLVSFMDDDLGSFDLEQKTCTPSTTRSARRRHPCDQNNPSPMSQG
jgi:hypothetical protein